MLRKSTQIVFATLLACVAIELEAFGQRDAEIAAPDGVKLKVTYFPALQAGPGILLLHQCNRERKTWVPLAGKLAAAGFHVLTVDYRGFGESGGDLGATPQERQRAVQELWPGDMDAAYRYLVSQAGVDGRRIGAAGASCGVNQSIQLARRHPEVRTIVLLSGPTNAEGRNFLRDAERLPILVSASEDDGPTLRNMRWFLSFANHPKNRVVEYKAAGHGTDMFAVEKGLEAEIVGWFEQFLRGAPGDLPARTEAAPRRIEGNSVQAFWSALDQPDGMARAMAIYEETKKRDPTAMLFPEEEINALGYQAIQEGKVPRAIELFKLNVREYPGSANVYDSLADGYVAAGNRDLAIQFSERALEMLRKDSSINPQLADAIRESAEGKLRQLRGGTGTTSAPNPTTAAPPRGAPPPEVVFQMPIVYAVPGMDRVQVRKDIVYKRVEATPGPLELKMDVYIPAGAASGARYPAVLLISGGGAQGPDWRTAGVYTSYGRLLAASGMVGIPFTKRYPRGPEGIAQGEADMADMVRYIREHAAELNIDADRLAVWAFSAGGMLLSPALRDVPAYIRAALSFYAVMAGDSPNRPEEERAAMIPLAPLAQLKKSGTRVPPIFIGRAGLDSSGLNGTIDRFVQEALTQNATIEVMNHAQGRHGFDILDNDARSKEIISRAVEFLKTHLGAAPAMRP